MTRIFKDFTEFINRENKAENGVSPEFANNNPDWVSDNKTNEGCWNCHYCHYCLDCLDCLDCRYCHYCLDCLDCRYCHYCLDCRDCRDCLDCRSCSEQEGTNMPVIPIIENIHQRIFEAASKPCALNMEVWHEDNETYCGTTHCRAGWAVHLAEESGYALEAATDTAFAALQIYKASSPIKVHMNQFFVTNEEAISDMERCAKEEAALAKA